MTGSDQDVMTAPLPGTTKAVTSRSNRHIPPKNLPHSYVNQEEEEETQARIMSPEDHAEMQESDSAAVLRVAAPIPQPPSKAQASFTLAVEEHVIWLETDGKEGRRANFSNMDFTGIDFHGANLQQANLRGAKLDHLDLRHALLMDADMSEASLNGVNASHADWSRVMIASASLQHATLDSINLTDANAVSANFHRANLAGAIMSGASFRNAALNETNMIGASLIKATLREADVTDTIFANADLTSADMRNTICTRTDFSNAALHDTSFKNAHFSHVSFSVTDFTVAHDIPMEGQNQHIIHEKETIAQEKDELMRIEHTIHEKQHEMVAMKAQVERRHQMIASFKEDEEHYIKSLTQLLSRLNIVRQAWIGLSLLLLVAIAATVVSMDVEELNIAELLIVLSVPVIILTMVGFTMMQVQHAVKRVTYHAHIRERKVRNMERRLDECAAFSPSQDE
ncbi:MAG: pentapeptide repeat-containing protein [Sphaerospermopsis sp. SIO1G2]|nr:pentapeptide repeat-containing protein [Sphaerospermopsis sp. SIO1G2]